MESNDTTLTHSIAPVDIRWILRHRHELLCLVLCKKPPPTTHVLGGSPQPIRTFFVLYSAKSPKYSLSGEFFHGQCMYRDLYWAHSGRKCTSNPRHPCKYHSVTEGRSLNKMNAEVTNARNYHPSPARDC